MWLTFKHEAEAIHHDGKVENGATVSSRWVTRLSVTSDNTKTGDFTALANARRKTLCAFLVLVSLNVERSSGGIKEGVLDMRWNRSRFLARFKKVNQPSECSLTVICFLVLGKRLAMSKNIFWVSICGLMSSFYGLRSTSDAGCWVLAKVFLMFCAKCLTFRSWVKHGTTACIENNSDEQQKANAASTRLSIVLTWNISLSLSTLQLHLDIFTKF